MVHPADRSPLPRDTVLLLACVAVSVTVLLLPGRLTGAVANVLRDSALAPLVALQQLAEEGRTSRARLLAAVAERDSALLLVLDVAALREENRVLRDLVRLGPREARGFVAADVLWQTTPTDGRTLLLSAGTRAGAAPFQPVVTGEGLVGVVAEAGPSSSVAHTWAHPEFRVSGVTEDGAVLGIVAPASGAAPVNTLLEFRGTAYRDTVPDGTLVITAGLGGVYPRGIPVGRVQGIKREELGWERVYVLAPAVNPGLVRHVLLLTRQPEPGGALPPGPDQ
jgi:rod shape-determining protein MreC